LHAGKKILKFLESISKEHETLVVKNVRIFNWDF